MSVCYQWDATIGGRGRPRLRALEPGSVGQGGGPLGFWQYDRRLASIVGLSFGKGSVVPLVCDAVLTHRATHVRRVKPRE